ncbi:MAG: polyketide cyclase [Eubacterium sp.]
MAIANMKVTLLSDIKEVWNVVTSCEKYEWRSDLSKIEVIEENKTFVEYTKEGYATKFTITTYKPYERYEFDMDNRNMYGHWVGVFSYENGKTVIDFTENVIAKKFFMKPLVGMYLKKQQENYIRDLKKAFGE